MNRRIVEEWILPQSIIKARECLDKVSIFQLYLTKDGLLNDLKRLLNHDIEWLKLIQNSRDKVEIQLKEHFDNLSKDLASVNDFFETLYNRKNRRTPSTPTELLSSQELPLDESQMIVTYIEQLRETREEEIKDDASIPSMAMKFETTHIVDNIINSTYVCYINLLKVLISKKDDKFEDLSSFAIRTFTNQGGDLDEKLKVGKFNYFSQDFMIHAVEDLSLSNFYKYFKEHFHLFIPKSQRKSPHFIHPLFQNELALQLNLQSRFDLFKTKNYFNEFISSSKSFKLFMQRNTYYYFIERALEQEYIFLSQLEKQRLALLRFSAELKITECLNKSEKNQIFMLNESGLDAISKNDDIFDFVKRSNKDCLIIVGRKNCPAFNFDIQLSFDRKHDDFAALFFLNKNGINLIDMSSRYSVKMIRKEIRINENLVLCFGKKHLFWIEECTGIKVENQGRKTIVFHSFDACEFTKKLEDRLFCFSDKDEILIGKDKECHLKLMDNEIQGKHAKVVLNEGRFYLCDLSGGNTSFLLKTRKRIESGKSSHMIPLNEVNEFWIHDHKFSYSQLVQLARC